MKNYKHKTGAIAIESDEKYIINEGEQQFTAPKWLIEKSNEWELIPQRIKLQIHSQDEEIRTFISKIGGDVITLDEKTIMEKAINGELVDLKMVDLDLIDDNHFNNWYHNIGVVGVAKNGFAHVVKSYFEYLKQQQ